MQNQYSKANRNSPLHPFIATTNFGEASLGVEEMSSFTPSPKPCEDPASPPLLSLESDMNDGKDDFCLEMSSEFTESDLSPHGRPRTQSEDNEYTIISFLDRSIK